MQCRRRSGNRDPAIPDVAGLCGKRRFRAILRTPADSAHQRQPVAGCLGLRDGGWREVRLQSDRHRRVDVCAGKGQHDRRAECRDGQGSVGVFARPGHEDYHQPGDQLLGEQGPLRPPPAVCQQPLPASDRCADRQAHIVVWRGGQRRFERGAGTRRPDAVAGAVHHAGAGI